MPRKSVQNNLVARQGRHEQWQQRATQRTRERYLLRHLPAAAPALSDRPSRTAQVMFGLLALGVLAAPFVDTALRAPARRGAGDPNGRSLPRGGPSLQPKSSRAQRGLLGLPPPGSLPPMPHADLNTTVLAAPAAGCVPVAPRPCVEWLTEDEVSLALPEVQSILWGWRWRSCNWDSCGRVLSRRDEAPNLAVQFDTVLAAPRNYYSSSFHEDTVPMDPAARAMVRSALSEMQRFVNIQHHEVAAGAPGNVYYAKTGGQPSGDAGQSNVDGSERSWVTTMGGYGQDVHTVFHENGHAHGFCHTRNMDHGGPDGLTQYFLPQDGWPENVHSSQMSYTLEAMDGYGPLDMAAFAFLYGTAPSLLGDTVHVLNANSGRRGWHDDDGDNTLEAQHTGSVFLDLTTLATSGSAIGDARVQLTPTSRFVVGNITLTQGGVLRGNGLDNVLIGSPHDDVIASGAGSTDITTGTGHDTVVVEPGAQVTVHDFDPRHDKLATSLRAVGITVQAQAAPQAAVVQFPSGERAILLGVQAGAIDVNKIARSYQIKPPKLSGGVMSSGELVAISAGASVGGGLLLIASSLGLAVCVRRRRARLAAAAAAPQAPQVVPQSRRAAALALAPAPLPHERPLAAV